MIVYNEYNQIAADLWNVWICTGGCGIFENSSVESYSRDTIFENYSVESDRGDKSGVNEKSDQQNVSIHSTSGDFRNNSV